jgi:hypothetical protein
MEHMMEHLLAEMRATHKEIMAKMYTNQPELKANQAKVDANLCVCVRKEWAIKSSPCTATFNDLLCYPYSSAH